MIQGLIPKKPVERVFIHIKGDPGVGIPNADFQMGIFFDPSTIDKPEEYLQGLKTKIEDLYREMSGESQVLVLFDYEVVWIQSRMPEEKQ